jgi:hypothetical protein
MADRYSWPMLAPNWPDLALPNVSWVDAMGATAWDPPNLPLFPGGPPPLPRNAVSQSGVVWPAPRVDLNIPWQLFKKQAYPTPPSPTTEREKSLTSVDTIDSMARPVDDRFDRLLQPTDANTENPRSERISAGGLGSPGIARNARSLMPSSDQQPATPVALSANCMEVKRECILDCSDRTLPTGDFGFRFWNCLNACMLRHGC